jgi:Lysine-specific metallo-endopeptidase
MGEEEAMASKFTEAYSETVNGLASRAFSTDGDWQKLVVRARKLVAVDGFDAGEAGLVGDLRKKLGKSADKAANEAVALFSGGGETLSGKGANALVDTALAKRLGALKSLRHTYLLKRFGGHKVWCVNIPMSFTDWPHAVLAGDLGQATSKLNDRNERFSAEQLKHLGNASQEALKWVHRAMLVAGSPKSSKNSARISRWFADGASGDEDMLAAADALNVGLKKIAAKLRSGQLIYVDSVSERGTSENVGTEAFVWGDKLDVVYIEDEFFGSRNTLKGLKNWARIVVHELSHREVKTKDHAYEHQGINPRKLTAAKAIENADSWAWFCADCAGALTDGDIKNALDR